MHRHLRNLSTGLFLALALAASVAQAATTFETGSAYYVGLGLQPGYPSDYDHLTFTGTSGIYSTPGTYTVSSLLFQSGYNAWDIHTDTGSLSFDFTVGFTTKSMVIPYSIFISYSDTITLLPGSLNFDIGGGNQLNVTTQSLILPDSVGSGNLQATITVTPIPEPETYAMMLAGLSLLGFVARRRKFKKAAAA